MIQIETIEVDNYYVEGFEAFLPDPLTIQFGVGKFHLAKTVDKLGAPTGGAGELARQMERVEEIETDEYPVFAFQVEADDLVDVMYDVYLLDLPSKSGQAIYVGRTELDGEHFPAYDGEDQIRYLLTTFIVPPGTTDLANVDIKIRKVVRKPNATDPAQ